MSFSDNQREIKERQEKLKQRLLQGDRGATFGHQYKDPCRKESELSIKCIDYQREHSWIDCKDYFDNFKNCKKFWVQEYRCRNMRKTRNDLPQDEELEKWRRMLPEWLKTNTLTPPADL